MRWLKSRIVNASARTEFVVAIGLTLGWPAVNSLLWAVNGLEDTPVPAAAITDTGLLQLLVIESVLLVALGWTLRLRGWTLARVGFDPGWGSTAIGVGLAAAVYGLSWTILVGVAVSSPGLFATIRDTHLVARGIGLGEIFAVSALNPLFEELVLCGYMISFLKERRGFWFALNASAGLRLVCHLYQGPVAVAGILPVGLVFGYWYARTGRLWPVIVAHAFFDLLPLLAQR